MMVLESQNKGRFQLCYVNFYSFFFNIYHVKFCFAANVWLRSSVGSTALIFGRNLFLLIPVEAWIYWDFLSAIFFNWSSPENVFLLRFHPQGKILWISFNCYVIQNLFYKKKVKLTFAGSVIQTVYQMSLRYLLSADCLELETNLKTYSTLRLHTCFRTLHYCAILP